MMMYHVNVGSNMILDAGELPITIRNAQEHVNVESQKVIGRVGMSYPKIL